MNHNAQCNKQNLFSSKHLFLSCETKQHSRQSTTAIITNCGTNGKEKSKNVTNTKYEDEKRVGLKMLRNFKMLD